MGRMSLLNSTASGGAACTMRAVTARQAMTVRANSVHEAGILRVLAVCVEFPSQVSSTRITRQRLPARTTVLHGAFSGWPPACYITRSPAGLRPNAGYPDRSVRPITIQAADSAGKRCGMNIAEQTKNGAFVSLEFCLP